ncbi:MAG: WYL domain-containing protein [Chitinivibrionales bacterium]|nr:WYL domain-containing protein [Chitinivibrionales bacterium]
MANWEKVTALHRSLRKRRYPAPMNALRDELECSPATFYRLLAFLRDTLGAPVVYDNQYKGYRYAPDQSSWELPGLWFTASELSALLVLQKTAESLQYGLLDNLTASITPKIESLCAAQGIGTQTWDEKLKVLTVGGRSANNEVFTAIAQAVLHGKKAVIDYYPLGKPPDGPRTISPQTLLLYRDIWYVDAFCHLRNDLRTFSLNRIRKATLLPQKAKQIPRSTLDSHFGAAYGIFSGATDHIARIKFTGIAAHEVSQETWHPQQKSEHTKKGDYILTIPYGNSKELVMDILKWGEHAEVLHPPALRQQIAQTIKKMKNLYMLS